MTDFNIAPDIRERVRHRALIALDEVTLAEMLDVPEGAFIIGMEHDFKRNMILLHVVDERFPVVPLGLEPPQLQSRQHIVTHCSGGPDHTPDETHKHLAITYDWESANDN